MYKKMNRRDTLTLCAAMLILFLFGGCRKTPHDPNWTYQVSKAKHSYVATLRTLTQNQVDYSADMTKSLIIFVQNPSPFNLGDLKLKWRVSWNTYNVWKPFLMMNGELGSGVVLNMDHVETRMINESYIDYTTSQPSNGIIMDTLGFPTIGFLLFPDWNSSGTKYDRAIGYQVVEFLIFGEDKSLLTPGQRPASDYSNGDAISARRRDFLRFSGNYLAKEFMDLKLSKTFEDAVFKADNKTFVNHVTKGLIEFVENDFAIKTVREPYLSQNANDELSRFSDNTMFDIRMKHKAIKSVLYGYEAFDETNGYFFGDLINEVKPSSGQIIQESLMEIENSINLIFNPFEAAILNTSDRQHLDKIYNELMKISAELKTFSAIFQ